MTTHKEALTLARKALHIGTIEDVIAARDAIDKALAWIEQEYPFGIYGSEDLDRAWKSGYENCKAQAMWTLEDVKKAWKRGYAAAKKEARSDQKSKEE